MANRGRKAFFGYSCDACNVRSFARSLARSSRSSFPFFLSSSHPVSEVCGPEALFTSPTPLACRRRAYLGRSQPACVSSSARPHRICLLRTPSSAVAHPPCTIHAVNRRPIHPIFFLAPLPTMLRSCHCFVTVQVWMAIDAAFPTNYSLLQFPRHLSGAVVLFLSAAIPLQGPVARFDFGAATLRCALACERRAWGGGVFVRDNDGIGACGRFELRTPTPIEQGVFCIPLVAFRLLGRRIGRRQGASRPLFLPRRLL